MGKKQYSIAFSLLVGSSLTAHVRDLNDHWSVSAEGVYMGRTHYSADKGLVDNSIGEHTLMDTKDLMHEMHFKPGYRLGLEYHLSQKMSIEGNYLYLAPQSGSKKIKGDQDLNYPFKDLSTVVDYHNADRVHACYGDRFWDSEANFWWHSTPRFVDYFSLSVIGGLRYFNYNEKLKDKFINGAQSSDYLVQTKNKMGAVQLGLNFQINPMRYMNWEFTAKGGVTADYATARTLIRDNNNTEVLRDFKNKTVQGGFFTDCMGSLGFSFLKHWNVYGGYQFIYFTGFASAEEQLYSRVLEKRKSIDSHAKMLIQGGFVGLTASF